MHAFSQVYHNSFPLALGYHVEGAAGKVGPDSWVADEWYERARCMVYHERYLTPAPFRLGLRYLPVNPQLGIGLRSRPGGTGSGNCQFENPQASSNPTMDTR